MLKWLQPNIPIEFYLQIPPGKPGFSIDVEALRNEVASSTTNSATESSTGANSTSPATPISKPTSAASDWNLLSQAIDRILFVVYTLTILIFLATYVGGVANTEAKYV